jgi:hypothetical protein
LVHLFQFQENVPVEVKQEEKEREREKKKKEKVSWSTQPVVGGGVRRKPKTSILRSL